ncbi:MAG: alanine racemase [Candidatus Hodarchaeota archaeon]
MRNIQRMARKARANSVRFRPHFKTHQSAQIGALLRDAGATNITVSSLEMARYFANYGWNDITVAFPVNILEIQKINTLAEQIQLNLLVESKEVVQFLGRNLTSSVDAWIKIDVGSKRTGIPYDRADKVTELAREIESIDKIHFAGLLTHAGHTYDAKSLKEIQQIHDHSVSVLNQLRGHLQETSFSSIQLSIGDTPSCSTVRDFSGVDEIRPGTFVFYDLAHWDIGACLEEDIGMAVACPVVAKHPERKELIIYGGAIHFSKDSLLRNGIQTYGYLAPLVSTGWGALREDCYLCSLSQEHGIVKVNDALIEEIKVGDIIAVLPVHCCLTANLHRKFVTTEGEQITY